jgi:hypothetical protein
MLALKPGQGLHRRSGCHQHHAVHAGLNARYLRLRLPRHHGRRQRVPCGNQLLQRSCGDQLRRRHRL